jgi:hypothetical protein
MTLLVLLVLTCVLLLILSQKSSFSYIEPVTYVLDTSANVNRGTVTHGQAVPWKPDSETSYNQLKKMDPEPFMGPCNLLDVNSYFSKDPYASLFMSNILKIPLVQQTNTSNVPIPPPLNCVFKGGSMSYNEAIKAEFKDDTVQRNYDIECVLNGLHSLYMTCVSILSVDTPNIPAGCTVTIDEFENTQIKYSTISFLLEPPTKYVIYQYITAREEWVDEQLKNIINL